MKSISFCLVLGLFCSPVLANYVPITPVKLPSCGCGQSEPIEVDLNEKPDDTRYSFDFEVQQPEPAASTVELKTYGYDLQRPVEVEPEPDTKYSFDYKLEVPETKPDEGNTRSYSGRVDRITDRKRTSCTCKYDPCDCSSGYSSKPMKISYILPTRYRGDDPFSRMRRSIGRRFHRQAPTSTLEDHLDSIKSFAAKAGEALANPSEAIKESVSKISTHTQNLGESIKENAQSLRDRVEKMMRSSDFSMDSMKAISEHAQGLKDRVEEMMRSSGFSDSIKEHAQGFKDRVEQIMRSSDSSADSLKDRMEKVIAAMHPDKIKEHITKLADKIDTSEIKEKVSKFASSIDPSAIKDSITKIADPIIGHASNMIQNPDEFFKGFKENFAVSNSRSKRSVNNGAEQSDDGTDQDYESDESDDNEELNEKRYPMLKVKDRQMPCETIKNLQKLSKTRVELRSPESLQYVPELAIEQPVDDAVEQPQYVEYINGEPVTYQPRRFDENKEKSPSPRTNPTHRVVFDRYGHRYFENNGNLRLVRPEYQEAIVGAQPNFAGLADILNQNREVLDELNPLSDPTRLVPQPIEIAHEGIELVRDIARPIREYPMKVNDAKNMLKKKKKFTETKTKVDERDESKIELNETPQSIYQMLPMNIDDNEGKLLVRVYSAKDSQQHVDAPSVEDRQQDNQHKSGPMIRKISRGDKDYEVITFDDAAGSSNEEVQQIYQLYYSDSEQNDGKQ